MKTIGLLIIAGLLAGCSTLTDRAQNGLAASDMQDRQNFVPTKREQAVFLAMSAAMQQIVPSKVEDIPKDGLAQTISRDTVLVINDEVQVDKEGNPIRIKDTGTFKWAMNNDLAGMNNAEMRWLYTSPLADGESKNMTQPFNGFYLKIGDLGESTTNAEAIKALQAGLAANKTAAGDATAKVLAAEWVGKTALIGKWVEVITATGDKVIGILQNLDPLSQLLSEVRIAGQSYLNVKMTDITPRPDME